MAVRRPIVLDAEGELEVLPAADTLPGGGGGLTPTIVDVDVINAAPSAAETLAVAGATPGQSVIGWPVAEDDTDELDPIIVTGRVTAADTVRLLVTAVTGRLAPGTRRVAYAVI
jgi:hypothetical protein